MTSTTWTLAVLEFIGPLGVIPGEIIQVQPWDTNPIRVISPEDRSVPINFAALANAISDGALVPLAQHELPHALRVMHDHCRLALLA